MKHLLFLIILFASCTKEVSKPRLRPPHRSIKTVDITIRFYPAYHPLIEGQVYGLDINASEPVRLKTVLYITWEDANYRHQLQPYILSGEKSMRWETMLKIINGAKELKLVKVDGDSNIVYKLKQIL